MPDEIKPENLRAGDAGLTPEETDRINAFNNTVERAVEAGLTAKGFITQEDAEGIVQRALRSIIVSRQDTDEGQREARKNEFYGEWFRAMHACDQGKVKELREKFPEQFRAAITSSSTTYTNVTPALIYNDILGYANEAIWHKELCRVLPGAPRSGIFPVGASTRCTAYRRTEGSATTDATPQMGGHAFQCIPLSVQLPVSNELLNEWAVPVLYQWFVDEMGYAKAIKEFTEFQTGTDSSQWDGIQNSITTSITTTSSDLLDQISDLYMNVPYMFRSRSTFWANATTLSRIWNAKDGTGRRYFTANAPLDNLMNRPLRECSVATNYYLYCGDLSRYHIYVGDSWFKTDNTGSTLVSSNTTLFFLNESNDGGPADDNAFRLLVIS